MDKNYHYNIVAKAIRFLREHYREQPGLDQVAAHVNLSPFHFQRVFREWSGVSPKQFLQYITLEHAKKCLRTGNSTLGTAYEVGLSGNGRLHDLFIKIESLTPGNFKGGAEAFEC